MSRLAKTFALFLSSAGLLLGAADANALACTSAATGNWNAAATWLAPCNVVGGPVAGDTVTIAAAHTVTVTAAAAATSITIAAPSVAAHGININPGIALNVSGAITMAAPAANNRTSTLAVGTGTLNAGSIAISGGTGGTRVSQLTVGATGIVNVTGAVTMGGTAAQSRFIATGASTITVGGAFSPGAFTPGASTLTVSGNFTPTAMVANTGTVILAGGAAQSMGAFTTYNNVIISKTVGTIATLAGNTSMTGSLTVTSGTLNTNTRTLGVAGNLAVNGVITGTTGNITLSGAAATINGTGSITTTTGVLSITTAKTILATANLTIASPITLSANVTVTNNGIINKTTTTALNGANATTSIWVNAANSTLNYAGTNAPMVTGVLTASANPNTVNYTGAAQAVKATTYHHLGFGGSLAKTAAAGLTVNGDLTLSGTATFTAGAFTHNFAGNWIVNTTAAAPLSVTTTSVINFNTPAIPAPTSMGGTTTATLAFADVNINNTSGVTFNDNASFQTGTTPTLTVAAGATLTPAAAVVISGTTGTLTGSGTVQVTRTAAVANFASQYTIATKTLTNLTVDFAGVGTAQTVDVLTYGSATGGGLKVSNASGVSLTANTTVAGTLTLASGVVNAGAFTLISSGDCTTKVARTGGHVAGLLQLRFPTGAPSCTFHVGDATIYRPINTSFASVTVAGNLVGSVSQAAGEHPQCCGATPFGLDSAKDVNRYWTITNPGGIVFTTYSATFNFINPTDFDAGATPANFEVENWSGAAWLTTTAGTRTLTSTQASGLAAFGDFAVGEKKPVLPGSFNAFETSTAAGAITGKIYTKLAGVAFSLVVVAISGGAQMNTFTNTVTVELLGNQTTGVPLDAQNCPTSFTLVQTVAPNPTITGGRSTVSFAAVANAWKDVRVRVRYPVASPTVTWCSTDNFSIRPTGFTVSSTNAGNTGTSGAPSIKTGAGFNLTATSVVGYNGTPAIDNTAGMVVGTPNQGVIGGVFAAALPATGTATGNAFFYSEAGNFGLSANAVFDNTYTSVDQPGDCTADFSNILVGGKYGCNFGSAAVPLVIGSSGFGRFIPDNFNVTYNTPAFGTACGTFGYVGQSFSFTTAPVMTVVARQGTANGLTNATTANYAGAYMKLTNTSLSQVPYDTTAGRYSRFDALGGGLTPALDTSGLPLAASDPAIGIFTNGVGTLTFGAGTGLLFNRTTSVAPFNADIALAINVVDGDGVAFAGNPAAFGSATAGGGIAFGGGKGMRFGRLRLSNASGSELLILPVPMNLQYWAGTTTGWQPNTLDTCTPIAAANFAFNFPVNPKNQLAACDTAVTVSGAAPNYTVSLAKPVAGKVGWTDLTLNLGAAASGNQCTAVGGPGGAATTANAPWLQYNWTGTVGNPTVRATFGVFKSGPIIHRRENY